MYVDSQLTGSHRKTKHSFEIAKLLRTERTCAYGSTPHRQTHHHPTTHHTNDLSPTTTYCLCDFPQQVIRQCRHCVRGEGRGAKGGPVGTVRMVAATRKDSRSAVIADNCVQAVVAPAAVGRNRARINACIVRCRTRSPREALRWLGVHMQRTGDVVPSSHGVHAHTHTHYANTKHTHTAHTHTHTQHSFTVGDAPMQAWCRQLQHVESTVCAQATRPVHVHAPTRRTHSLPHTWRPTLRSSNA